MALICIGTYSINNTVWDVFIALFFGVVGYFMQRYQFSPAATVLGLVLGFLVETNMRRSLMISDVGWAIFVTRPGSAVLILVCVISLLFPFYRDFRDRGKKKAEIKEVLPAGELM